MNLQRDTCRRSIGVLWTIPCGEGSQPKEQSSKPFLSTAASSDAWGSLNWCHSEAEFKSNGENCNPTGSSNGSRDRIIMSQKGCFWVSCLGDISLEGNCGLSLALISEKLKWCPCTSEAILYRVITHPPTNEFQWNLCSAKQKANWWQKISIESSFNHFKNSIHRYPSS